MSNKDNQEEKGNIYIDKTYSSDIYPYNMFSLVYKGLRIIPSKSAAEEMTLLGLTINDCKKILELGYEAPRKRAKDKEERWFNSGNKIYNIVIGMAFNNFYKEDVWVIIHVGRFTKKQYGKK